MHLSELFNLIRPAIQHARSVSPGQGDAVATLLATSAIQLDSAGFGARLYALGKRSSATPILDALGEDHTTIEISATLLAVRGSVTALDLCGAVLARLTGKRPGGLGGNEWDIGWWLPKKRRPAPLTGKWAPFQAWLDDLDKSDDWHELEEFRHAATHRYWRRDVTVSVPTIVAVTSIGGVRPPPPPPAPPQPFNASLVHVHIGGKPVELEKALPHFVSWTEERWKAFVALVEQI